MALPATRALLVGAAAGLVAGGAFALLATGDDPYERWDSVLGTTALGGFAGLALGALLAGAALVRRPASTRPYVATPALSARLAARVARDFGPVDAGQAQELLAGLVHGAGSGHDPERLQAAAILRARGRLDELRAAIDLGHLDPRDLLMGTGLEHGDWTTVLDDEFGRR